jgi:hypothetical protein
MCEMANVMVKKVITSSSSDPALSLLSFFSFSPSAPLLLQFTFAQMVPGKVMKLVDPYVGIVRLLEEEDVLIKIDQDQLVRFL